MFKPCASLLGRLKAGAPCDLPLGAGDAVDVVSALCVAGVALGRAGAAWVAADLVAAVGVAVNVSVCVSVVPTIAPDGAVSDVAHAVPVETAKPAPG